MPIRTRTIEQWTCDRCSAKAEFPDEEGQTAFEVGWLQFDLGRSLNPGKVVRTLYREKNEQILCPACAALLAAWFQSDQRKGSIG